MLVLIKRREAYFTTTIMSYEKYHFRFSLLCFAQAKVYNQRKVRLTTLTENKPQIRTNLTENPVLSENKHLQKI